MTDGTDGSHWTKQAQRWGHIKPPLRPGAADLAQVRAAIARHYEGRGERGDALLFGVTPELAALRFPPGVKLRAFDQSQPMIDAVWPGDTEARSAKICNWFSLDLPEASIGMALGDGCFSTLDYPEGYPSVPIGSAQPRTDRGAFGRSGRCVGCSRRAALD